MDRLHIPHRQLVRREVLQIERDDDLRLRANGGCEDVTIIRVWQINYLDQWFIPFD
ncbi:hypothetical protein GCM10019016_060780 [Streptomyces prasinosporus]|uniref:UbiC transcription regulator-associated domain-containing protein n=1 Tax=Streptomyces prasinosporus TaxID=68256 RepID=A0ABP6TVV9_9ACTN